MRSQCLRSLFSLVVIALGAAAINAQSYSANLSSAQEVPVNASTATGYSRIFLDETAGTITFTVVFNGLTSNQTAAHIHAAGAIGVNGPVVIDLGAVGGTSGTLTGTRAITPTQITQLRSHLAYVNVHSNNFPGGEIRGQIGPKRVLDFDGDGRTDYSILRFPNVAPPGVSQITFWNRNSSGFAANQTIPWGNANTDFPAPGDFDGDGEDDFVVYRAGASAGQQSFFIIFRSSDNTAQFLPWGVFGDATVARDYDGDGITDAAIFRRGASAAAQTQWFILRSSDSGVTTVGFGLTGNGSTIFDSAIPGDYDGDGKFDIAVYRFGQAPANTAIVLQSSNGAVTYTQWGNFNTDWIAPGDYDGDGKWEIAAVRTGASASAPMTWWIRQSSNAQVRVQQFGISSDFPTQGDYDGDGVTDISIWRAAANGQDSAYYTIGSFVGFFANSWGLNGDFSVNRFDTR